MQDQHFLGDVDSCRFSSGYFHVMVAEVKHAFVQAENPKLCCQMLPGVVGALAICPWLDLALSAPSLQRNRSQASESSRPAGTDPALQSPLRRYLEV